MNTIAKDTRGREIKRVLQKAFPSAVFSVKLSKYSMGESIRIHTDLFKDTPDGELVWKAEALMRDGIGVEHGTPEYEAWKARKDALQHNEDITRAIRSYVGRYESIDRDVSGEILGGGNTYIQISRI